MDRAAERLAAMRRREQRPECGPQHVVVDLTNRCNNNCIACWTRSPLLREKAPDLAWQSMELSEPVIRSALKEFAAMGCEVVRFTGGGEPTLHPAFEQLVELSSSLGMSTALTTNGTLIDRMSFSTFAALDELTVSLWSASPATYARLHPNKTGRTFGRVVDSMRHLKSSAVKGQRPTLVIANVIGMMNHHELEQMVELAVDVGADRVYFAVVDPTEGCTDGLLLDSATAARLLGRAKAVFDRYRGAVVVDNELGFLRRLRHNDPESGRYDRQAVDEVPCLVGWGFIRILANGDVVPCCRAVARPMGNINRQPFSEVWGSPEYREFRSHSDESKSAPYFSAIGCDKTCDNLMHNEEWFRLLSLIPSTTDQEI